MFRWALHSLLFAVIMKNGVRIKKSQLRHPSFKSFKINIRRTSQGAEMPSVENVGWNRQKKLYGKWQWIDQKKHRWSSTPAFSGLQRSWMLLVRKLASAMCIEPTLDLRATCRLIRQNITHVDVHTFSIWINSSANQTCFDFLSLIAW